MNGDQNLNTQELNAETSAHWSITGSANCLPIGTRLAEFEITGVVGEGGFGNVYLAFDHSLQRTVAIKEYMPVALASRGADNAILVQAKRHKETFETGMNSFINEARLLAQFDHPALIKVYRFWEQNNTAYMAMRYYEGQTFKAIISKNPGIVTEAWLKPILKPILEALEVLYKIQILHRDISPDNIMIQPNGDAVLLDFGAARQILGDMSQALTVILKPGYAPVEQYAEDSDMKQGPWTDIYALSAAMYYAIVKKAPPTSVTRLIKDPVELLQLSPPPGFSKGFLAAIDKGMAVRPNDRPQSIEEFTKLLGIDQNGSMMPTVLPRSKSSSGQKKTDASSRPNESREAQKSKPSPGTKGSGSTNTPKTTASKISTSASWILLFAGVLAAGTGIYRMTHRESQPAAIVGSDTATAANQPVIASPSASTSANNLASAPVTTATGKDRAAFAVTGQAGTKGDQSKDGAASHPKSASEVAAAGKASPVQSSTTVDHVTQQKTAAAPASTAAASPTSVESPQTDNATAKATAVFKLSIRPWANVYVDGTLKGVSPPLKRMFLSEGKHQIRLVNPSFPDHSLDIVVNDKKRLGVIDFDFSSP
jgi:serine/threonine protein kinase